MILFASNGTGWDETGNRPWPGGMTDAMIAPILPYLDAAGVEWTVARWPEPGWVNAYLATASIYAEHFVSGPATPMICHGIADKNYRTPWRGGMHPFSHIAVPGPAHAIRAQGLPNVVVIGYPKLTPLFTGDIPRVAPPAGDTRVRVLWAPTHGGGGEAGHLHDKARPSIAAARRTTWWDRQQVLQLLPPDRFRVTEAPHPRHRRDHRATLHEYAQADVVVADAGSTIYEAWALGLPVVFCDWLTAKDTMARPRTLEGQIYRRQLGFHATQPRELTELVEKAAVEGLDEQVHEFMEQVLPTPLRGAASAQRHAEFLTDLYHTHRDHLEQEGSMARRRLHDPHRRRQRKQLRRYLRERGSANPAGPVEKLESGVPVHAPQAPAAASPASTGEGGPTPAPVLSPDPVAQAQTGQREEAGQLPQRGGDQPPHETAPPPRGGDEPPPQTGPGSGAAAWRDYLAAAHYDPAVLATLTRQQLIALHNDPTLWQQLAGAGPTAS